MPFVVVNNWFAYSHENAITESTGIRQLVFTGTVPEIETIRDFVTVEDALASSFNEASNAGYSRPNPTITFTPSNVTNSLLISAPATTLPTVTAGGVWTAVGWYVHIGSDDGDNIMIGVDIPSPSTITPDGRNVILPALELLLTGA